MFKYNVEQLNLLLDLMMGDGTDSVSVDGAVAVCLGTSFR